MDDIAHLVLAPFQDIVNKGNIALGNADGSELMSKAAQTLVKEGERALKRIEPLCTRYTEEHGLAFHNAVKENGEITGYRSQLNDLLWDFDDYIGHAADFDPDKFAELQALSRKAAPKIYDSLMTIRFEPPADVPTPSSSVRNSTAKTDSPVPRHVLSASPFRRTGASNASPRNLSVDGDAVEEATRDLEDLMAGSPNEYRPLSYQAELDAQSGHDVPYSTSMPRSWGTNPSHADRPFSESAQDPRRPSASLSESPVDPAASPFTQAYHRGLFGHHPRTSVDSSQLDGYAERPLSHDSYGARSDGRSSLPSYMSTSPGRGSHPSAGSHAPYPRMNMVPSAAAGTTIPENGIPDSSGGLSRAPRTSSDGSRPPRSVHQPAESCFGGFEARRPPILSKHSRSSDVDSAASPRNSPRVPAADGHTDGLQVTGSALAFDQSLPIPVATDDMPEGEGAAAAQPPSADCVIGDKSSFWLAKGFCEGAKEVLSGRIGVKKTKKPVGFTSATTVARCTACMCEHDFKEIEKDVNKQASGTYSALGVSYRLRFLQKSHIEAKRADDVQYGCVFCVQQGFTLDGSDATVFFTPRALLDHVARHPRPLPEVPGINVVDCVECPSPLRNNFDLLFTRPPMPHPAIEGRAEAAHLPSGVAREPARRLYGKRLLFDRSPALELAVGARVTGLTWPLKYNGDWALGWHDGEYASVPTDVLKLDVPPHHEIRKGGSGMIRARAKWRFHAKDKDAMWLRFDRNEMITNIGWSFFDHWCWSGTNARGKWGIFPQAFIDTNTLEEPTGSDRAESLRTEKDRSVSFMAGFRRKQSVTRPAGVGSAGAAGADGKAKKRAQSVQQGRGVDVFLGT